jgi:hypothetical protein
MVTFSYVVLVIEAGLESPVDPRQVQGVEPLADQASEPESAEGECEATGQREDKYPPRR